MYVEVTRGITVGDSLSGIPSFLAHRTKDSCLLASVVLVLAVCPATLVLVGHQYPWLAHWTCKDHKLLFVTEIIFSNNPSPLYIRYRGLGLAWFPCELGLFLVNIDVDTLVTDRFSMCLLLDCGMAETSVSHTATSFSTNQSSCASTPWLWLSLSYCPVGWKCHFCHWPMHKTTTVIPIN